MSARTFWRKVATVGYAVFVTAYFVNYFGGCGVQAIDDVVKTLPVLFLGAVAICAAGRVELLSCALLLSAAGDLAGEHHLFLWQVGLFLATHIAYAIHFFYRAHIDRTGLGLSALLVCASVTLGAYLLPHIANSAELSACGVYIAVISVMALSVIVRQSAWRWLGIVAAMLFMFSDGCIAVNKFVAHIPHAGVWIMATYFVAQYIFALIYLREQEGKR